MENIEHYPEAELQIFNRWGELLFESDSIDERWTEPNQSDDFEMDTYIYGAVYRFIFNGVEYIEQTSGLIFLMK